MNPLYLLLGAGAVAGLAMAAGSGDPGDPDPGDPDPGNIAGEASVTYIESASEFAAWRESIERRQAEGSTVRIVTIFFSGNELERIKKALFDSWVDSVQLKKTKWGPPLVEVFPGVEFAVVRVEESDTTQWCGGGEYVQENVLVDAQIRKPGGVRIEVQGECWGAAYSIIHLRDVIASIADKLD